MIVEGFFNLLIEELKQNPHLTGYYRFLNNPELYEYRKAYFCQRLQYISDHIPENKNIKIFDIGCGYGTTAIFLVLNRYKVNGITLEYYYEQINNRKAYWSKIGDLKNLGIHYENLFDKPLLLSNYNVIIAQDVLHHIEPITSALNIISKSLIANGKLIACEENGNNILNTIRLFFKRQNKRIIQFYDDRLDKNILMGNENIHSLKKWTTQISKSGLLIDKDSVQYIRLFFPWKYKRKAAKDIIQREQEIWKKNVFVKEYFFHGLNFTATKK